VRADTDAGDCQWPVAKSSPIVTNRITIVRMKVAKSELTFSTPTFAKIAVSAAKPAESNAQTCQDQMLDMEEPPFVDGFVARRTERRGPFPGKPAADGARRRGSHYAGQTGRLIAQLPATPGPVPLRHPVSPRGASVQSSTG